MRKKILVLAMIILGLIFTAGSCGGNNPTGPSPACALCAQQTQTEVAKVHQTETAIAILGTATATETFTTGVISTASFTATATSTIVVGTSTSTSTSTVTATATPRIGTFIISVTGTPGDTFVFNEWNGMTYVHQDLPAVIPASGIWTSDGVSHVVNSGAYDFDIFPELGKSFGVKVTELDQESNPLYDPAIVNITGNGSYHYGYSRQF